MKSVMRKARRIEDDNSSLKLKSLSLEKSKVVRTDKEDESDTFRKRKMDPLTEYLGCTSYYHKMRWPWLEFRLGSLTHKMEVDRYYHEKKLAIDIGKVEEEHKKQKQDLFKLNNINYIILESATDMKNLALGAS